MLPGIDANRKAIESNREVMTTLVAMLVSQNKSMTSAVRGIATTFTDLADDMEQRDENMAVFLEAQADQIEASAVNISRDRAKKVLTDTAAEIRKAAVELRKGNN